MKKLPILGFYGYWVILTYLSVIFAAAGIFSALNGDIKTAVICLMGSGVCDMFDGSVARLADRTEREKAFGIQIDSLADITGFGILPSVIGYAIFASQPASPGHTAAPILGAACLYILAALIRLAYYNVTEAELQSRDEKRQYYEGLPVTSAALIIPVVYYVCICCHFPISRIYNKLLLLLSLAFVLRLQVPKLKLRYLVGICLTGFSAVLCVLLSRGGLPF
ncbi:MAG: hypothetical protein HFE83_04735 [Lachnospiraceae bacterium]|nr:hypothetical protein [Lachnospiraceae bacterium]